MKTKETENVLIPIGKVGYKPNQWEENLEKSATCAASDFLLESGLVEWDNSELIIDWDDINKKFNVIFKGKSFSNPSGYAAEIPLVIAESSKCVCGQSLSIGDYSIKVNKNNYSLQAKYYCKKCRTEKEIEEKGFFKLIKKWLFGLSKIEISATGASIERKDS